MPTLDEAKYSAEELRALLGKGQAMRNEQGEPSYPIVDEEDLGRAIKAVGRGGGSHNKIRAYIVRRAKALGKSDMIPEDWSKSGASKGASSESAQPEPLEELTPLTEAATGTGRRRRIQLIDAGWSKNGRYYSPQVLAEAAAAGVYKASTAMFIDHPTATEKAERPERSVKDLAARLTTDAVYKDGALVAEATLLGPWVPFINEVADQIGVSIRAAGTVEYGEADGREGLIVTEITEGISVDFVTDPAAGGRVLELIESAREQALAEARNIGGWLESRLHAGFTEIADDMYGNGRLSRDERMCLSSAVGEALEAFVRRVEADHPQLYQRDLWQGPPEPEGGEEEMAEAAPAVEQPEQPEQPELHATQLEISENAPGSPPADTQEKEGVMPELTDEQARELEEARATAETGRQAAVAEATAARADAEKAQREAARLRAAETARPIAVRMVTEADIPAPARVRVLDEALRDVPLTEDNRLDEAGFKTRVDELVQREAAYLASLQESSGAGQVRGLGESAAAGEAGEREQASLIESNLREIYKRRGLSEEAAQRAAAGRL